MKKRIISLFMALVMIFGCCSFAATGYANDLVDSTLTLDASSSTAKKIYFTGTDTIDVNSTRRKFTADANDEGIYVNSAKDASLSFVKSGGKWIINFSENVASDTTVMVKGTFTYDTTSVRFATITVKYNGSAWEVVANAPEGAPSVTLTSTEGWSTFNDGTNWTLVMNASYAGVDTTATYNGFKYFINGVEKTTGAVTFNQNGQLVCSLPLSDVPATGDTTFTVKAGEYASQSGGTGIKITEDFDIIVVEGRLAHTQVVEAANINAFNNSGENPKAGFFVALQDENWNGVSTGTEDTTWTTYFINPAWCDGTRVDDGEAGFWTNNYGGVFVDTGEGNKPLNYWDYRFKNVDAGMFHINLDGAFTVTNGTVVTIRGFFVSAATAEWNNFNGNFYLPEMKFIYEDADETDNVNGAWRYLPGCKDITLTSTEGWSTSNDGTNWTLVMNANYTGADTTATYDGFKYLINGVEKTTGVVTFNQNGQLVCSLPLSDVPATGDTTFTIKAGEYASQSGGAGIKITEDFDIIVVEGRLAHTQVVEAANINAFNNSGENPKAGFYVALQDENWNYVSTGTEDTTWNAYFINPAWCDGTRVDDGEAGFWTNNYGGVFVDTGEGNKPLNYWEYRFKNVDAGIFHINLDGAFTVTNGSVVTVRGFFVSAATSAWNDFNGNFYLPEMKFIYEDADETDDVNGAWRYVEGPIYTDHTGTPVFESSQADGFYFTAGETEFPYDEQNWTVVAVAEDENSGIFLSQDGGATYSKLAVNLQKVGEDRWFAYMAGDTSVTLKAGDIALLKGTFVHENHKITFTEAKFIWDGTVWGVEVEVDEEDIVFALDRTMSSGGDVKGIFLTATDSVPYDLGWGTNTNACAGVDNGVFLNGVKTEVFLKKYESNKYYVCLSDASVEPEDGDTVTIKGAFKTEDYVSSYQEYTVTFKNGMWLDETDMEPVEVKEKNVKLTLDKETFGWQGGTESGIYLFTDDNFAVDANWRTPIYAVAYDDNSGIFFNGKKVSGYLKKHADGMIYLDIAAAGIFAEDKDVVTIKGTFALDGYGVSYAKQTFYYNGQSWGTTYTEPIKKSTTTLSPIGVVKPSSFNPERKAWDIYVQVDGAIPGGHDYEYKTLVYEVNGKSYETSVYRVDDKLVFFVPESIVSQDAKDGTAITLKAGTASDNYGIYDIKLAKDCTAYVYRKAISGIKPTEDTPYMDVTIPGLIRTWAFNEDIKEWQLFFIVEEDFDVENGTQYYGLPVKLNGKSYEEINVFRSGECLYISIPESVLPRDAKSAELTIAKGGKATANAGWNGIRLANEVNVYMFDGVWNNIEFKEAEVTDLTIKHMNFCSYNSDVSRWDIYLNVDKEIPGTAWFEYFDGLTVYLNGKEYTTYANKAESENNRLLYISLSEDLFGKFKDGDILYIPGDVTWSCGGYKINNTRDFYLQYVNGTWFEYYESDVEAPEALDSLWEKFRIDGYIPVQEEQGIMFVNTEPTNVIKSVEDMKDVTFTFETTKMLAMNEELPTNSFVLRGQPLNEQMGISETALYGYNISFSYIELTEANMPNNPELWGTHSQEIAVWKNGINYNLLDQYRMTYNWKKTDHPFFEYDETYKYTVSIYNVAEDICVIEVYCNDELVMRVVDHASDDPKDPARNAGEFQIYASCPQYFYAPAVELDTLAVSASECYIGEQVRVSATYPAILEGAEYTVDGEGAVLKDGVFSATKAGTYTVSGTYNGVDKGTVQIKVSEEPKKDVAVEDATAFPIVPVAIGGGLVIIAAAVSLIIFLKKKKNKKNEQVAD